MMYVRLGVVDSSESTSNIGHSKVLQLEVPRLKKMGFEYPMPCK